MADVVDLKSGDKITGQFNNDKTQQDLAVVMMNKLQAVVNEARETGLMNGLIISNLHMVLHYETRNLMKDVP